MDGHALYWEGKQQKGEGSDYFFKESFLKWERDLRQKIVLRILKGMESQAHVVGLALDKKRETAIVENFKLYVWLTVHFYWTMCLLIQPQVYRKYTWWKKCYTAPWGHDQPKADTIHILEILKDNSKFMGEMMSYLEFQKKGEEGWNKNGKMLIATTAKVGRCYKRVHYSIFIHVGKVPLIKS